MVKRVLEMDTLTEHVVLTGGVAAHNPILQEILEEEIGREVLVPPRPQFTGAMGAALFALESHIERRRGSWLSPGRPI